MSIIQILVRTGIMLGSSIIQVFAVVMEGLGKLFTAFGDCLYTLRDKLLRQLDKPKKMKKPETRETIDLPL